MGRIRAQQFLVTVFTDTSKSHMAAMIKSDIGTTNGMELAVDQVEIHDVWVQPIATVKE